MLTRLVLAIVLIGGILLFLHWYNNAPPVDRNRILTKFALYGGLGVVGILILFGKLPWFLALLGGLVPLLHRVLAFGRMAQIFSTLGGGGTATPGQTSAVNTRFIKMTLNHDSGEMSGEVLEGNFKGRELKNLKFEQLIELLEECQQTDQQSASVLMAYLDRNQEDWRENYSEPGDTSSTGSSGPSSASSTEKMSKEEAYEILGLEPGVTTKQIKTAHRRLMQKFHPDRGGPTYLAALINQAKDLLLTIT
ncbi:DnaJ domain-containing protein [Pseudomonadota bacterium]